MVKTIIKLIISQWQLVMFIDFPWLVPPCSDPWPIGSAEVSALRALLGGRPIWSNRAQGIADSHKSSQPINRRTWFEVDFGLSMLCVFFFSGWAFDGVFYGIGMMVKNGGWWLRRNLFMLVIPSAWGDDRSTPCSTRPSWSSWGQLSMIFQSRKNSWTLRCELTAKCKP